MVNGMEAPSGSRLLKVNVYSGVDGYNSPQWNNWNVKTAPNTSGLRYADSSASAISLALSRSEVVRDNGPTYGGGMAPENVLRTTSYSTTARTLTFSGLSASANYSLEFYSSRANTGNSTTFTIGGATVTVLTDNNKTDKALFTGLKADAFGNIVVTINGLGTYNYLNGFILTESNAAPLPGALPVGGAVAEERSATPVIAAAPKTAEGQVKALSVRVAPNPSSTLFALAVKSAGNEPLHLRVLDALGREVERRILPAQSPVIRLGAQWKAGTYYAEIIGGKQKAVVKLLKTAQ